MSTCAWGVVLVACICQVVLFHGHLDGTQVRGAHDPATRHGATAVTVTWAGLLVGDRHSAFKCSWAKRASSWVVLRVVPYPSYMVGTVFLAGEVC